MIMRNHITALALSLTLLSSAFSPVYAQTATAAQSAEGMQPRQVDPIAPIVPVPDSGSAQTYFGQDHAYTVTFRGNGEAVVSAKITFSNLTDSTISSMSLRAPKGKVSDVLAFQVLRERQCIRYSPMPLQKGVMSDEELKMSQTNYCEEYQDPDYYQYWYGNTKYQKSSVEVQGDTIVIGLPSPINPNATGSFMLYYRAAGYATKTVFGGYSFTFETLKAEDRVRNLQVGISTDSDLVLRGANGNVNYVKPEAAMDTAAMGKSFANSQMDSYYQQIGQGTIVKNASNLQPLESYTVKGSYAASTLALYGKEISIVIILGLSLLAILGFVVYKLIKRFSAPADPAVSKQKIGERAVMVPVGRHILESVGVAFVSSLLTAGYTVAVFFVTTQISMMYAYQFTSIIMLFVAIISICFYSLLMFAPAIYLGIKRGYWWGIATFVSTTMFLLFYLFIAIMVIMFFRMGQTYPYGGGFSPMMYKGAESKSG